MIWVSLALAEPVTDGEVPPVLADTFRPSVDNPWMLTVDESGHGERLHTNARELISYANRPLVYTSAEGDQQVLIEHVQREDTLAATTWGRFRLGTTMPYYAYLDGEIDASRGRGDLAFDLKATLVEDKTWGLAASGRLIAPTSNVEGLGYDSVGWELQAIADRRFDKALLAFNVAYRGLPTVELENFTQDDQLALRAGLALLPSDTRGVALEANAAFQPSIQAAGSLQAEGLVSGFAYLGEAFQMRLGVGKGLSRGIGIPRARVVWVLAYEPSREPSDLDADGVPDERDPCPEVPEDLDDWRDEDGCPEPTWVTLRFLDPEGIPVPAVTVKVDGAIHDGGGENLEPGRHVVEVSAAGFQPERFLIEVPNGPPWEGTHDLKPQGKGTIKVLLIDPDGNDVPGAFWALDGEAQGAGKKMEVAPGEYTISGYADGYLPDTQEVPVEMGFSHTVALTLKPTTVRITEERIELGGTIYFETGNAVIREDSYGLLDDVAATLMAHPEIEGIRIEGHTDTRADDAFNQTLSEDRAQAVRAFLIDRGVDAIRLEAVGYGESRPVDDREVPEAWEKNRRVDFFITERE